MENAAEALKMAAWVLIFVVALSICINSFTQARQTMDTILEYNDREYSYTYVEENLDSKGNVSTQRIVGFESIIPSIYRAYKENYKIIFKDYTLYTKTIAPNEKININYIDLEKEAINNQYKDDFIKGILFGKDEISNPDIFPNIIFPNKDEALYNKITSNNKFKEELGIYYQEETDLTEESSTLDANKTKKRVITYTEEK